MVYPDRVKASAEFIVAPDPSASPVSAVRGSIVFATQRDIKRAGLWATYLEALSSTAREQLPAIIAASWVPIALAVEHYRCLQLVCPDAAAAEERGARSVARLHGPVVNTVVRGLRAAGALSPPSIASKAVLFFGRLYVGGDVVVIRRGNHGLEIEFRKNPLCRFEVYRFANLGVMLGAFHMAEPRLKGHVVHADRSADEAAFRFSW